MSKSSDEQSFTHDGAPLAEGINVQYHGSDEHEEIRKDGRHTLLSGRVYMGSLTGPASAGINPLATQQVNTGSHLMTFDLSPSALGGRVLSLARTFQQFKFKRLRVMYVPTVSAQTDGGIMVYFTNELSVSGVVTGDTELAHVTALGNTFQTVVWKAEG
jgi:hypothetical protein